MKLARLLVGGCIVLALRSAAFAKDITVDASGAGADFKTVQEAIDSVDAGNTERVRILIKPGKYEQQLTIARNKPMISLIGQGAKPDDTVLTYHLKASDPRPDGSGTNVGTTGSSSTFVHGDDFIAENLTFANSAGDNVGQAVALKTTGDRLVFRNCRFLGFQDTLYPTVGRVYFKDCYITGDTDFIFGSATAVFDHCTINSSNSSFITAANTKPDQRFGFVFLDCTLTASDSVKPGSTYLGRPWQWDRGSKAAVTFLRTKMGPHIKSEGWHPWDGEKNTKPEENTRYSEFGSTDLDGKPIDLSGRISWSKQLTAEDAAQITVESVLKGMDGWNPTKP
jgi:pectinesterase